MPIPETLDAPARREQQQLLWRIHRRYETVTETVEVGRAHLTFTRIADPNRVLDMVADEEDRLERVSGRRVEGDRLHLPYWAELWDSALGLATWMEREGNLGDSVLDLGCGMGLAGTVAARMGARVFFADLEPPAILFARLNSLPWQHRVRARRLNWQTDRLGERFNLILGADILYERAQWPFLDAFWRSHLRPAGRILLGEPGRQTGTLFITWIQSLGWELEEREQPVSTRSRPIRILCLRKPRESLQDSLLSTSRIH